MFFSKKKLSYYIFQIGFNRCATSSFTHFFNSNGYQAAHWRAGKIAVGMELARLRDEPLLTYCKEFDVYTDMEKVNLWRLPKLKWRYPIFWRYLHEVNYDVAEKSPIYAFKYFKKLDKQYPDSKFIFNTRNVDKWIESRLNLNRNNDDRISYRSCRCGDNVHETEKALADCWYEEWHDHCEAVRSYFADKPNKLLTFHIEEDSVNKITDFFSDISLDEKYWERKNPTK